MTAPPSIVSLSPPASPHEALKAVCDRVSTVPTELVPLAMSRGRVVAQTICADRDSPPLHVSAMDGYAIRMQDLKDMASAHGLPIEAVHSAIIGQPPAAMQPGCALHIATGAPVPIGAEAVVRYEDVAITNQRVRLTVDTCSVAHGANIRKRGENAQRGDTIAQAGQLIGPGLIGAMASFGVSQVCVNRRVRVALLTTGDELVGAHEPVQPWHIRDSNGPVLQSLLGSHAWIEVVSHIREQDDAASLTHALNRALDDADAVIVTGGVSMGHKDFVPHVVSKVGAETIFHKLPQRPGRPMLAAIRPSVGTEPPRLILGLPGNPVSVMVTARRLGLGMLGAMAGLSTLHFTGRARNVANADGASIAMWWYRLVTEGVNTSGHSELRLLGGKGSGDIASAALSIGFIEVAPREPTTSTHNFFAWTTS